MKYKTAKYLIEKYPDLMEPLFAHFEWEAKQKYSTEVKCYNMALIALCAFDDFLEEMDVDLD